MAPQVEVFEVGPRDGLQNESFILSTPHKIEFVQKLLHAGIRRIELGSFVRPDFVPQMADTDELHRYFHKKKKEKKNKIEFWSLVPNVKGFERAQTVHVQHIALFTAVSDQFTKKNIGMSVKKSFSVMGDVIQKAERVSLENPKNKIKIRGYISTAFGCPYQGKIKAKETLKRVDQILELGVDEISIGDTIGVADPVSIEKVFRPLLRMYPKMRMALHVHDTRGTALANALKAYELGVRIIDASAGGLGGCPYAPGASGNLATEDLVYMLEKMGVRTGVDIDALTEASLWLSKIIHKKVPSKVVQAYEHSKIKNKKWL